MGMAKSHLGRRTLTQLVFLALSSASGCVLAHQAKGVEMSNRNREAVVNAQFVQPERRVYQYVTRSDAWICESAQEAAANGRCANGKFFERGKRIKTIGDEPEFGAWRAEYIDGAGLHSGYIAATKVSEVMPAESIPP